MKKEIIFETYECDQLATILYALVAKIKDENRTANLRILAADSSKDSSSLYRATFSHPEGFGQFGEWQYSLYEVSKIYELFAAKVRNKIDVPKGVLPRFSKKMLIREMLRDHVERVRKFIRQERLHEKNQAFTDLSLCLKYLESMAHFAYASDSEASLKMKTNSSIVPGSIDFIFCELHRKNIFVVGKKFDWNKFLYFVTADFTNLKTQRPLLGKSVDSVFKSNPNLISLLPTRTEILINFGLHPKNDFNKNGLSIKPSALIELKDRLSKQRRRAIGQSNP